MLQLHYYPSTAAMIGHIVLEELGTPFEWVLVDRTVNAHKAPGYLRLNPNGLISVLTDGDWCFMKRRPSPCTCATRIRRRAWRRRWARRSARSSTSG